ncbi:MAG: hypothetical protein ABI758_06220 [Candidatus Woesebacteria bacterium]
MSEKTNPRIDEKYWEKYEMPEFSSEENSIPLPKTVLSEILERLKQAYHSFTTTVRE